MKFSYSAKRFLSFVMTIVFCLSFLTLPALADTEIDVSSLYKKKDVDDSVSDDAVVIELNDTQAVISGAGASVSGSTLTITSEGDYVLSGTWQGQVVVEATEEEKVHLILEGVTITSAEGPAIYEKVSDKLILTLAEGTTNILTDATSVSDGEDTLAAALYAEDDLSINGTGTLVVNGVAGNGIQSKADLVIACGDIQVTAEGDGIKGRNSVLVLDGTLTVNAQGDGIVSTRDNKEGKGYVVIAGGTLNITTGTGATSATSGVTPQGMNRMGGRGWTSTTTTSSDSVSQKGIKAATDLTVLGGVITINSTDDGLHAVNVTVSGGTLSIQTGDDGIHADTSLTISGGTISILQCSEGIESSDITVSGGVTTIVATDDGVNATNGSGSSFNREASDGSLLLVTGGELYVTAGGDALDSNGNLQITGGVVGIYAMSSMGDGAIDYNGTGSLTGGTLIIASTGTNMTSISGISLMALSASGSAGTEIQLLDASGNLLGAFTPQSSFSTVLVASVALESGSTCTVSVGGNTAYTGSFTANSSTGYGYGNSFGGFGNSFDNNGFNNNNNGFGGHGGRGGRGGW